MFTPQFVTKRIDLKADYGRFELTPLPAGYGHSFGNALRRVLLSSMEGSAVTYVRINETVHQFDTISGIKESVLDIVLNLKRLRFKVAGEGPFTMRLNEKAKGRLTAKAFEGGDVEIVNKDEYIAEITKNGTPLEIELTIEQGVGYSPSEEKEKKSRGSLAVDSVFSPVTKVNYLVEGERVGRKTNFDKLILEIWTDGSLSPEKALSQSAKILAEFYQYILSGQDDESDKSKTEAETLQVRKVDEDVYSTIIDELDLPTRVVNALLREGIETIGDLVERGREDLVNLKGVGRKSIDLVEGELEKLGVTIQ